MNIWLKAIRLWDAGQVSHHGAYSLVRFSNFNAYSQSSRWYRVLLVLITTPIPPLAMMIIIDSIPLQNPSDGWKANWVFWFRCALAVFALTFGTALQFHVTSPAATFSIKKCILIAAIVSLGYTVSTMGVANFWGFPIPFQLITCVGAWHFWLIVAMVCMLGRKNIATNVELRRQAKRYIDIVQVQAPLLLFYPAYSAVFMRLSKRNQTAFIFVLPVVKFLLKNALAKTCAGLGDFIPTIVISIDLFNSIYQSKSLQSSGSIWTALGIVLIDVIQNIVSMLRLHRHVRGLYRIHSAAEKDSTTLNLLAIIADSCQNNELLEQSYWKYLQEDHYTTPAASSSKSLASLRTMSRHRIVPQVVEAKNHPKFMRNIAVKAFDCGNVSALAVSSDHTDPTASFQLEQSSLIETRTILLKRSLELLRRTEFMLLVEYIECAIPMLYAIYLPILMHFENRKYYPDVAEMTESKLRRVVTSVLMYALLELGSLLYVQLMIMRNFQFSALRQLAFILEKDCLVIQASFMTWTLVIFQFMVAHFGTVSHI